MPNAEESRTGDDSKIYVASQATGKLRQGEIITDLIQIVLTLESMAEARPRIQEKNHPIAIVLSQDCDLDQDGIGTQRIQLPNILFCEVDTLEQLKTLTPKGSDIWKRVKQNKDERYHVLQAVPADSDAMAVGLGPLGIDFKRYFTIPVEEVYIRLDSVAKRRCRLVSPYIEHLSNRFAFYQSRVAIDPVHSVD